jgi:hypothetical protein
MEAKKQAALVVAPPAPNIVRNVGVAENRRQASVIMKDGNEVVLGEIVLNDYTGDGIRQAVLEPADTNPFQAKIRGEKPYNLGVGREKTFDFMNPADAQRLMLERGWKIADLVGSAGGTIIKVTFTHPTIQWDDVFDFDYPVWDHANGHDAYVSGKNYPIQAAVTWELNMLMGFMAVRIDQSLLRTICTNTAVGSLLQLPGHEFRHGYWTVENVKSALDADHFITFPDAVPLGPVVGTRRQLNAAHNLLANFRDEIQKRVEPTGRFAMTPPQLDAFRPAQLASWAFNNYLDQINLRIAAMDNDNAPVYAFDLVNAYTSAINLHRKEQGGDKGIFLALNLSETIIKNTTSIASLAGMFTGLPETYIMPPAKQKKLTAGAPTPVVEPVVAEDANMDALTDMLAQMA